MQETEIVKKDIEYIKSICRDRGGGSVTQFEEINNKLQVPDYRENFINNDGNNYIFLALYPAADAV